MAEDLAGDLCCQDREGRKEEVIAGFVIGLFVGCGFGFILAAVLVIDSVEEERNDKTI